MSWLRQMMLTFITCIVGPVMDRVAKQGPMQCCVSTCKWTVGPDRIDLGITLTLGCSVGVLAPDFRFVRLTKYTLAMTFIVSLSQS